MFVQAINPVPVIPSTPGWCLQYVREAYGITPGVYPTASAGWLASPTKHMDKDFPAGCAVPLWFAMEGVPAGHVVLRQADGSIYSTTEAGASRPTLHPNLDHLMGVYARAGLPLTYLGWTEDIENTRVIERQEQDIMATLAELEQVVRRVIRTELQLVTADGETGKNERGGLYQLAQDVASIKADVDDIEADVDEVKDSLTPGQEGVRHAGEAIAAVDQIVKSHE